MSVIISIIVMILWIAMISTSSDWIGTKLGDIFVILIGVSSIYGCMIGVESLIKWAMK